MAPRWILVLVLIILVGCGSDKDPLGLGPRTPDASPNLLPENSSSPLDEFEYCHEFGAKKSPLFQKIVLLHTNKNNLAIALDDLFYSGVPFLSANFSTNFQTAYSYFTPLNPLTYGPSILQEKFDAISEQVVKDFGVNFHNWLFTETETAKSMPNLEEHNSSVALANFKDLVEKINGLYELSSRWRSNQCFKAKLKENEWKDVRSLYFLDRFKCREIGIVARRDPDILGKKICLERLLYNWDLISEDVFKEKPIYKDNLLRMCENAKKSLNRPLYECLREWDEHEAEQNLMRFYINYRKANLLLQHKNYYSVAANKKVIDCKKNNSFYNLTIKFNIQDEKLKELITQSIDKYVDVDKYLITVSAQFGNYPEGEAVEIEDLGEHLPNHVVKNNNHVIHLNKDLVTNPLVFKMIFAHELGHVLGLKDCYVEIMSQNEKEITYYEISNSNLMCSVRPNNYFPLAYLNTLTEQLCY